MLNELIAEYPTAPRDKLEKVLSCAYALVSPESNELGLHNFPIENIPVVAKLLVSNYNNQNIKLWKILMFCFFL